MVISADRTAAGDQLGWELINSAARPAVCGLDIEVPLIDWNSWPGAPRKAVGVLPARMFTPGAVTSGLRMSPPPAMLGPRDEKSAIVLPPPKVRVPPESEAVADAPLAAMYALTASPSVLLMCRLGT